MDKHQLELEKLRLNIQKEYQNELQIARMQHNQEIANLIVEFNPKIKTKNQEQKIS